MKENKSWIKNKNMVSRNIAGECILMPICKNSRDLNCIYSLNTDAAWVWERIDGKRTTVDLQALIAKNFRIDEAQAEKHLRSLLNDLSEIKALL